MALRSSNDGVCLLLGLVVVLSGCAGQTGLSLFPSSPSAEKETGRPTGVDACRTPEMCATELRKMIKDPKRDWVGQPQSPEAYANGTRFFAYRALRKSLSCAELKRALADTKAAASSLQSARYQRVRALSKDVDRELKTEHDGRCPAR
jgi:hypothetical protein